MTVDPEGFEYDDDLLGSVDRPPLTQGETGLIALRSDQAEGGHDGQ